MDIEQHFPSLSSHNSSKTRSFLDRMSKINPEQLRSVTASTTPSFWPSNNKTAPLTIFYKGEMVVFPLPPHKARNILDLAHKVGEGEKGGYSLCTKTAPAPAAAVNSKLLALSSSIRALNRGDDDIPIARKKSLHQFLVKRKQRLTVVSPYS